MAKKTKNIKIEFRSTELPKFMYLFNVKKYISPFVPRPTICRKCLRFGHVANICKSSSFKCNNCTIDIAHTFSASCICDNCLKKCSSKCQHCDSSVHNSFNGTCEIIKKQQHIKNIMITENIDFMQAKAKLDTPITNNTYANITNMTQQMENVTNDLNNTRKLNDELLIRIKSLEFVIAQFKKIFFRLYYISYNNTDRFHI